METYCIYLRKSRADLEAERLGEMETLSRHMSILTRLAERNGHVVSHIYREIVSGDTIEARPEVQQLLSDVSAGKWTGVYVMEVERLARGNTMDQGYVAEAFSVSGTLIVTPLKTYNPLDQSDEEYLEFGLFMSRREYKTIKRRLQTGIYQSAREGKVVSGHVPYGYRAVKLKGEKGFTMEPYEDEAKVVRQVFDWYINGIDGEPGGTSRIAKHMLELGIPAGERGTTWLAHRINHMLSNPAYIGMVVYGKTKRTNRFVDGKKKHVITNQKDYILVKGKHQPIIDDETFETVQEMLHGSKQRWHPVRKCFDVQNPFIGMVYCSQCGHLMGFQPTESNRPDQILCRNMECTTVRSYIHVIEDAVLETLRIWLENDEYFTPESKSASSQNALVEESIQRLQVERETVCSQLKRAYELIEMNVYSVQEYNERHGALTEHIASIDAKIAELQAKLANTPMYADFQSIKPQLIRLLDVYEGSSPAQKNELLKACISKIVYTKEKRRGQVTLEIYPKLR